MTLLFLFVSYFNYCFSMKSSIENYQNMDNINCAIKKTSEHFQKKFFYIRSEKNNMKHYKDNSKELFLSETDDSVKKNYESFICGNKHNCSCGLYNDIYHKFKKKLIFNYVVKILNEFLENYKKNCQKSNGIFCSGDGGLKYDKEKFINYLNNFIDVITDGKNKDNSNRIAYLCSLTLSNPLFLKDIGDILWEKLENIKNKTSFFKNIFINLLKKEKNVFNLFNEDYNDYMDLLSSIYSGWEEISNESTFEVTLKKYKLVIYKYIKDEVLNVEEKKIIIDNILKISEENEKNQNISKDLKSFVNKLL